MHQATATPLKQIGSLVKSSAIIANHPEQLPVVVPLPSETLTRLARNLCQYHCHLPRKKEKVCKRLDGVDSTKEKEVGRHQGNTAVMLAPKKMTTNFINQPK